MSSVLDHYNLHSLDSKPQWEGIRSSKFARTKLLFPHKDIISPGLDFPSQLSHRGQKHFPPKYSPQKQYRSTIRMFPRQQHWHPKQSRKRIVHMSFTEAPPRKQMAHIRQECINTERSAGIRTFYNAPVRQRNIREYSLEDRMQRKVRVDQKELRRTFFLHEKNLLEGTI